MDENIVITSVKTGEIYKLKGDVQQAFAFRDRIKALIGESFTDDEAISRIDHLESFHAENLAFRANVLATLSNPDNAIAEIKRLQEFRDRVKAALYESVRKDKYDSYENIPDDDAITFISNLVSRHKHWERDHEIVQFALEVKQLLIDKVGKDLTDDEAIAEIKRLQQHEIKRSKSGEMQCLEIENRQLKQQLSGIASFLGLPNDAKQPEICYAIIEMRKTLSKPQENTANLVDNSYIAIENLQHELRIANKVIARLLGE